MVFTSLPLYLDPPNWNQRQSHDDQTGGCSNELQSAIQPTPSAAGMSSASGGGTMSRVGPMAERTRVAKIPHPDPALKCPRCDSTNTKFCYFNNYSLSQPRHFCKTCRRYWTRGGALRTVPVGGGCRRNKRSSKPSASKSNNSSADRQAGGASTATSGMIPSGSFHHHQLPFLGNLHPLSDFGAHNLGLNFNGLQPNPIDHAVNYQCGGNGLEHWRIQQFPSFLGGMDSSSAAVMAAGTYYNPFDQSEGFHGGALPKEDASSSSSTLITQMASVKMEDRNPHGGLNLARQYLGNISGNIDQYNWGGGGGGSWAPGDLSGFNS